MDNAQRRRLEAKVAKLGKPVVQGIGATELTFFILAPQTRVLCRGTADDVEKWLDRVKVKSETDADE